jgi:uncharacterized RDD family membrane protein YckC
MTDPIRPGSDDQPPDASPSSPPPEPPPAAEPEPASTEAASTEAQLAETPPAGTPLASDVAPPPEPPTAPPPPPPPAETPPPAPPPAYAWAQPAPLPPGPAPGYVYVGFWRRFFATLIDGILFAFVYWILFALLFSRTDTSSWRVFLNVDPVTGRPLASDAEILAAMQDLIGLWIGLGAIAWLIHFLYLVIFWSWQGGTIGQLLLGIQVRREADGQRIGIGTSILRYIGYVISVWVFYLGLIWVAFDARKQGWHDKIAGTLVIRRAG